MDNSGKYRGFNVEVMQHLTSRHKVKLEYCPMKWEDALLSLKKGDVDVIQGMVYSPERAQSFLFCYPTNANSQAIFAPIDSAPVTSVHNLKGKCVSVQEGDINSLYLTSIEDLKLHYFSTQWEAMEALVAGEVDAFVGDELTGRIILEQLNLSSRFRIVGHSLPPSAYSPAVRHGDFETYELINDTLYSVLKKRNGAISEKRTHRSNIIVLDQPVPRREDSGQFLVGSSRPMQELKTVIDRIKDTDAPVLITGETGSGKEQVVKAIHAGGNRRGGPLEVINCASLPVTLIESELFGYEKGAFTGSLSSYPGKFALADGGILFLDEIAEMDNAMQAKLLRVIQDNVVCPLGSTRSRRVNVRVIAATNRDLKEEIRAGRFRADLYYRLSVFELEVPPLRLHREDIPELAQYFLEQNCPQGEKPKKLAPEALEMLKNYDYPGNVRELQNIIKRAAVLCPEPVITPRYITISNHGSGGMGLKLPYLVVNLGEPLREIEERVIKLNLKHNEGTLADVARRLGISERTLRNRMKEYQLKG